MSSWKRKDAARPEHRKVQVAVVGFHGLVSYAHTCELGLCRVWSAVGLPKRSGGGGQRTVWQGWWRWRRRSRYPVVKHKTLSARLIDTHTGCVSAANRLG